MFEIGDFLVYRRDVCKIVDIKKMSFNNSDYYVLIPISDESLKMKVPKNSASIRALITKKQVEEIISKIAEIKEIESVDLKNNLIEKKYRELLNSGSYEDLISIIKTTYLRKQERLDNKKSIGDKEANFFRLAEQYLYNEFAIVLGINYEDAKKYVMHAIEK